MYIQKIKAYYMYGIFLLVLDVKEISQSLFMSAFLFISFIVTLYY